MKNILIVAFVFISNLSAICQANLFIKPISDSSFGIFLNENGIVTNLSNAKFYRVLTLLENSSYKNCIVNDYSLNNILVFKGKLKDGMLNDSAYFFYENGTLKEKGLYQNGLRIGKWIYYYDNNQKKKTLNIQDGKIQILELYSKKGKQLVNNGDGKYKDDCLMNFEHPEFVSVKGDVLDGNMDGKWKMDYYKSYMDIVNARYELLYNVQENYKGGNLIKGYHSIEEKRISYYFPYTLTNTDKNHNVPFINILDYNVHEHIDLFKTRIEIDEETYKKNLDEKFVFGLQNFTNKNFIQDNIFFENTLIIRPSYKGMQNLNLAFIPDILEEMQKMDLSFLPDKYFIFIEFSIEPNGLINNVSFYDRSVINDMQKTLFIELIKKICMSGLSPAKHKNSDISYKCDVFIPIIYNNRKIEIAPYDFGILDSYLNLSKILNK